jgi:hypothetical protein
MISGFSQIFKYQLITISVISGVIRENQREIIAINFEPMDLPGRLTPS